MSNYSWGLMLVMAALSLPVILDLADCIANAITIPYRLVLYISAQFTSHLQSSHVPFRSELTRTGARSPGPQQPRSPGSLPSSIIAEVQTAPLDLAAC